MQWVSSSSSLPHAGEPIRFLLDERTVSIDGEYAGGVFRSRWGEYDVGRVQSWCASDTRVAPPVPDGAGYGAAR